MKTACFIDGYNVYYGLVHGTNHKWLDLFALVQSILTIQSPSYSLEKVYYFTSPVLPKLASRGEDSLRAQHSYLRALKGRSIEVIEGKHRLDRGKAPAYVPGQDASRQHMTNIWSLEEKQTDVNLALTLYRFALAQERKPPDTQIEQVVLFSNDSDFGPALEAIRSDFPRIQIGVIAPIREGLDREPSGSLRDYAHWIRKEVKESELSNAHFPDKIPTRKKPIFKPDYW